MVAKAERKLTETEGINQCALLMDVQIGHIQEECVSGMGQSADYAAKKDAQIRFGKEECASGMEQSLRSNNATKKVAQIKLSREECALGMEPSTNDAAK